MAPVGCQWLSGVCIGGKTCSYNFGLPTKGWICVQFLGGSPPVGAGLPAMGAVAYQQVRGARIAGKTCSYNFGLPTKGWICVQFLGGSPPVGAGLPAMGAVVYQQVRGARIAGKTCSYNLDCPPRVGFVSNFLGAVHLWERACPRWGPCCISRCAASASLASQLPQGSAQNTAFSVGAGLPAMVN